jgi:hypothetical protein
VEAQKRTTGGFLDFHLIDRPHLCLHLDEGVNDHRSLIANQPFNQIKSGSSMLEEIDVRLAAKEIAYAPGHHWSDPIIPVRWVAQAHDGRFSGLIRTRVGAS